MKTSHRNHTTKRARSQGQTIRVAELFAGVGGFRVGFERASSPSKKFMVVWSNQWEPATKKQHASEVYEAAFGSEGHSNENIAKVSVIDIPDHDLLVGGFPCQDYSVARNLSQAAGIAGKKGVLWWEIHRIVQEKGNRAPSYLMLENVDRLLKSPASQRGRDFAIMLASLNDLGYIVEWRIINAAEYGMPQRRKRIFMLGYRKNTSIYKEILKEKNQAEWLLKQGTLAKAFPVKDQGKMNNLGIKGSLAEITKKFNKNTPAVSPFLQSGIAINREIISIDVKPDYKGKKILLKDVLVKEKDVPEEFFIKESDLSKWQYLKGAKSDKREGQDGFTFFYTEGAMVFPDSLDRPSRTIITAEGGTAPSRFKHVIKTPSGRLRRLLPIELERLCMFPDNHTAGKPDTRRAFFMGNALVVGVIEKIGKELLKRAFELNPSAKQAKDPDFPFSHHAPIPYKTSILAGN